MKAAIVGLVRGNQRIEGYSKLIRRNRLLHRNFNKRFGYPVVIFHEGNICVDHQCVMKKITPNLDFVDVSGQAFVLPPNVPREWQTNLGYKHMCRFYSWQIYEFVTDFDYIMRLDDDSFLESPIRYDLFEFMRAHNLDYGYVHKEFDYHGETIDTLPAFTRQYVKDQKVAINCSLADIDALYYYSNFLVTRVAFWQQANVQQFLTAVDKSMGIYHYRWGDHVIQTHALKMFSQPDKIRFFADFNYSHQSHRWANYQTRTIHPRLRSIVKRIDRRLEILYLNYLLNRAC